MVEVFGQWRMMLFRRGVEPCIKRQSPNGGTLRLMIRSATQFLTLANRLQDRSRPAGA